MIIKHKRTVGTKQLITIGSLMLTAWLLISGLYFPDSFTMRLADAGLVNSLLRAAVLVLLLAVLFSRPPRSTLFRSVLGSMSSVVLIVSAFSMANYQIGILDAILYLMVSIIFALEALEFESQPAPVQKPSTYTARVKSRTQIAN